MDSGSAWMVECRENKLLFRAAFLPAIYFARRLVSCLSVINFHSEFRTITVRRQFHS